MMKNIRKEYRPGNESSERDTAQRQKNSAAKINSVEEAFVNRAALQSDPLGSYTGRPQNKYEKPVQDADDL